MSCGHTWREPTNLDSSKQTCYKKLYYALQLLQCYSSKSPIPTPNYSIVRSSTLLCFFLIFSLPVVGVKVYVDILICCELFQCINSELSF